MYYYDVFFLFFVYVSNFIIARPALIFASSVFSESISDPVGALPRCHFFFNFICNFPDGWGKKRRKTGKTISLFSLSLGEI